MHCWPALPLSCALGEHPSPRKLQGEKTPVSPRKAVLCLGTQGPYRQHCVTLDVCFHLRRKPRQRSLVPFWSCSAQVPNLAAGVTQFNRDLRASCPSKDRPGRISDTERHPAARAATVDKTELASAVGASCVYPRENVLVKVRGRISPQIITVKDHTRASKATQKRS